MNEKQNFYDLQIQFFEIFQAQDPENEDFDVIFEIGGKKLYANKSRLTVVSPTFKSMLAKRWTSKNDEPIQINEYKFEDFKEFLTFIFSGKCSLNDDNIFAFIDIAEFYGVQIFKNACDQYLSKMELTMENIFEFLELSNEYSLVYVKRPLKVFVVLNFNEIEKSAKFLDLSKSVVKDSVSFVKNDIGQELIFQAIYKWAEHQAIKKQNKSIQKNSNLNDAIKAEITPLLRYIRFNEMSLRFLIEYVVKRSFLFSGDELSKILDNSIHDVKVKITNSNGQSVSGSLPYDSDAVVNIKKLKNISSWSTIKDFICWRMEFKIPSTPSSLKKKDGIEWYLIYTSGGYIGAVPQSYLGNYSYILAEMSSESSEFVFTKDCKIEIC